MAWVSVSREPNASSHLLTPLPLSGCSRKSFDSVSTFAELLTQSHRCAWIGDKYHIRGPLVIFNALLGLVGLPLLGFATNNAVRYFGVFLATTSCNANVPTILTYQANNIRGQWKRALASATLVGMGGVGGIVGSTIFREQDKPAYRPGMYGCILASGLIVLITCGLTLKFHRANKRAASGGKAIEGLVGFRYTL